MDKKRTRAYTGGRSRESDEAFEASHKNGLGQKGTIGSRRIQSVSKMLDTAGKMETTTMTTTTQQQKQDVKQAAQLEQDGRTHVEMFETARAWSFLSPSRDRCQLVFPDSSAPRPTGGLGMVLEDGSEIMVFRETGDIDCKIPCIHESIERVGQSQARPDIVYALEDTHLVAHVNWHRIVEDELVKRSDYYGPDHDFDMDGEAQRVDHTSSCDGRPEYSYQRVSLPIPAYQLYDTCPLCVCQTTGIVGVVVCYPSRLSAGESDFRVRNKNSIDASNWKLSQSEENDPTAFVIELFAWTLTDNLEWKPLYSMIIQEVSLSPSKGGLSSQKVLQVKLCGSLIALVRSYSTDIFSVVKNDQNLEEAPLSLEQHYSKRKGAVYEWTGRYEDNSATLMLYEQAEVFFPGHGRQIGTSARATLLLRRVEKPSETLLSVQFFSRGIASNPGNYIASFFIHSIRYSAEYEVSDPCALVFNPHASKSQWLSQTCCDFAQEIAESSLKSVEEMFCLEDLLEEGSSDTSTVTARKRCTFEWEIESTSTVATTRGLIAVSKSGAVQAYSWNAISPVINNRRISKIEASAMKFDPIVIDTERLQNASTKIEFGSIFTLPDSIVLSTKTTQQKERKSATSRSPGTPVSITGVHCLLPLTPLKNASQVQSRDELAVHVEMSPTIEMAANLIKEMKLLNNPRAISTHLWNCFALIQSLLVEATHRFDFSCHGEKDAQFRIHMRHVSHLLSVLIDVVIHRVAEQNLSKEMVAPIIRGITHTLSLILALPHTQREDIVDVNANIMGKLRTFIGKAEKTFPEVICAILTLCSSYALCDNSAINESSAHTANNSLQTINDLGSDLRNNMQSITKGLNQLTFSQVNCKDIAGMIELICQRSDCGSSIRSIREKLGSCLPQSRLRSSHLPTDAKRCLAVFDVILFCPQRNRQLSPEVVTLLFDSLLLQLYEELLGMESVHCIDLFLCTLLSPSACKDLTQSQEVWDCRFNDCMSRIPMADVGTLELGLTHVQKQSTDVYPVIIKGCLLDLILYSEHKNSAPAANMLSSEFVKSIAHIRRTGVNSVENHCIKRCWEKLPQPLSQQSIKDIFCPEPTEIDASTKLATELFTLIWNISKDRLPHLLQEIKVHIVDTQFLFKDRKLDIFSDICLILSGIRINHLRAAMLHTKRPQSILTSVEAVKRFWNQAPYSNPSLEAVMWRIVSDSLYDRLIQTEASQPLECRNHAIETLKQVIADVQSRLGVQFSIYALPTNMKLSSGWSYAAEKAQLGNPT